MINVIDHNNPNAFITKKQPVNYYIIHYNKLSILVKGICKSMGASDEEIEQVLIKHSEEMSRLAREAEWLELTGGI